MVPGVPIKPQLARICEGFTDAVRLLGPGAFLAGADRHRDTHTHTPTHM